MTVTAIVVTTIAGRSPYVVDGTGTRNVRA
jgi:hypothetical protein